MRPAPRPLEVPRRTNSPSLHFGHLMPSVIGRVYLHFGYFSQPMKSPKRPARRNSSPAHVGHFSPMGTSGAFGFLVPLTSRRVVLQSGYPVHARKVPNCPRLMIISLPQLSQYCVAVDSSTSESPGVSARSRVKSQSG